MTDEPSPAAARNRALPEIIRRFNISGNVTGVDPFGQGLIHRSLCITVADCDAQHRFLLQRINTRVFPRPTELMENIDRVTAHLAAVASEDDTIVLKGHGFSRAETTARPDWALAPEGRSPIRRALTLIPTLDGRSFTIDDQGAYWRMYRYIENTRTLDRIESAEQCFQVARAFGEFQRQLTTLPPPRLHDTIPGFHDTPRRFAVLEAAIAADVANRVQLAGPEIEFALARRPLSHVLLNVGLPERVTHNDTKINNVLLDSATGLPVCVIDLDTVMPGLAPYDFGDMVRTATCPAAEDERDLTKIYARFDYFEALARGYLAGAGSFLTRDEKQLLTAAGKLITFEQGIRFLADYLAGDTYYPVARDTHNLDRCRTQWRLLESLEAQERPMNEVVASLM